MYNIALFGAGRIGQVVHSVNIDAVLIASATNTHADLIELAAKAGKAIFCEKPVHLDMTRVNQCLAVVDQEKVPLFIGFNRRYDPQFSLVEKRLRAGDIGKPESLIIISRDPAPPPVSYIKVSGGLFRDMMIHDFDMARFIMGENPVSVYASGSSIVDPEIGQANDIDTAFVVLRFPSGAMATISNSRRSGYGYDQRLEVHGQKGVLTAKNINENTVECWTDAGCTCSKPEFFFLQRYMQAYQAEWAHFVDVLKQKTTPAVSGIDGKLALYLADSALESLRTGKEVALTYNK